MHKFSDFADEPKPMAGEKKKINNILNIEIVVVAFRFGDSKHKEGEYLTIQFKMDEDLYICFTGSTVLIRQAHTYKDKIPFQTIIKKVHDYYTFS